MAYDPNSAYQPPRRAYYVQPQQQAPIQNGYGYQAQEQYNDYSTQQPYGQGYQGYDQQYAQSNQYGQSNGYQDVRGIQKPQSPQFPSSDGYYGSQRNPKQPIPRQPNGYEAQQQQQPSRTDRQYDPRYQQRQDRGRQPNQNPQTTARAQLPIQPQQRPERGRDQTQNQHRPVMGHHPVYDQAPKVQEKVQQPAPQPPKKQPDPAKMTMEEWKAKEKARMHAEAMLPETLAQDNAFPVFPTNRERSKVRNSGTDSARASGELQRPATSSGHRHERKESKSRGFSDSDAATASDFQQQFIRPPLDHKPHSADQVLDRSMQPPVSPSPQQQVQQSGTSRYVVINPDSPIQERAPPQSSPHEQHRSPPPAQSEWVQPPPQSNGPVQKYEDQVQRAPQDQSYVSRQQLPVEHPAMARTPPPAVGAATQQFQPPTQTAYQNQPFANQEPRPQPRQPPQRGPPPQPIDTSQAQQQSRPAYMDHQPLSPGQVPPRPSTSHGQRSPLGQSMTSPTSSRPPMPQDFNRAGAVEPPKPWAQPHAKQDSLDGIYGHYEDDRVARPVAAPPIAAPPRTREEEIEADMPDFDSAAPGGTSLLHKRSQPFKETPTCIAPPMPTMPPQNVNPQVRGFQAQEQWSYNQQAGQPYTSTPEQRRPNEVQGGIPNGHVYGLPGQNNPRKYGASYDSVPPQQTYEQRPPQPPQQTYEQGPPQPPFANDQPRRSMDDARQMPYRQGPPPPQHFAANGQPPPGTLRQHRPKPRPGNDRNFTDLSLQRSWTDPPPQERIGSAPPTQQNFQVAPPRAGNGMQVARQMFNPEQPVPEQRRSDPDSLPQHPTPVRPGHTSSGPGQSSKPPPVRNHDNVPPASHQRQASNSINASARPVTAAELDQLRSAVDANPNDQKRTLLLVKKLVEASTILASEGGRADPRTQAKNRERYIMDADKRLRKLVASGYAEAQFFLADCYGQGTMGLPVNPKEAFTLYQAAAKAGHAQAAYRTAMCCELGPEDGGTSKDYGKAAQWYRRGAALGDADAMFKIGIILLKGLLGQQRNIGEAVNFLKRAVEQSGQGNPHALFELAQLYESAQTNPEVRNKVVADDKYALELFQQAASAGHKGSQFRLGQAYEYGNLSAPIDNRASIMWYTKAASQGEHQAELALSGWYLTGADGILQQSDTEAYLWARKAAASEPPLAKAMFAMGYFTETGIGCPKSIDEAKKWYARAATYRFPKAQERLEELKRSGSKSSRPVNGKLSRKDQKRDEENCVLM